MSGGGGAPPPLPTVGMGNFCHREMGKGISDISGGSVPPILLTTLPVPALGIPSGDHREGLDRI